MVRRNERDLVSPYPTMTLRFPALLRLEFEEGEDFVTCNANLGGNLGQDRSEFQNGLCCLCWSVGLQKNTTINGNEKKLLQKKENFVFSFSFFLSLAIDDSLFA
ncbi:hypothetical protein NE237_000616 [Protea cynaroides]|uniref:Uncharacterized protein n=1 Tax=Protea cynaroides TaxID=273540 RepID=A0A9Q0QXN5_9MAGN|nr:hypothetical protein NE237_000616 [Protea cynaroides]